MEDGRRAWRWRKEEEWWKRDGEEGSRRACRQVVQAGRMMAEREVGEEACDVYRGCELWKRRWSTIGDRGSSQRRRIGDGVEGEADGRREAEAEEKEREQAEAQQQRDEEGRQ